MKIFIKILIVLLCFGYGCFVGALATNIEAVSNLSTTIVVPILLAPFMVLYGCVCIPRLIDKPNEDKK